MTFFGSSEISIFGFGCEYVTFRFVFFGTVVGRSLLFGFGICLFRGYIFRERLAVDESEGF